MDDAFFGAPREGGKRGRGTAKTPVVVVSLALNADGHPLYVKMRVVENMKAEAILKTAEECIAPGSKISADLYRSYNILEQKDYELVVQKFDPVENPDHLHWIHTIISNAKAFIAGTYHGLGRKHLQRYLDEFCYRFNRRKFAGELFNRLLNACISAKTITYAELT